MSKVESWFRQLGVYTFDETGPGGRHADTLPSVIFLFAGSMIRRVAES